MTRPLTLLCAAKLHANQLERHLELFEHLPEVGRVILVRHAEAGRRLAKIENSTFPPGPVPLHALRMRRSLERKLSAEKVDWVLGFNPVPWGSLALSVAKRHRVRTCLSLIGRDILQVQKWWGRPFLNAIRRADAVTVTGAKMLNTLETLGVARERLFVLPHSVDLGRFVPRNTKRKYEIISVGQLIQRKRMDLLIEAVACLAREGLRLRTAILGKGPLKARLQEQAARLGVADLVEFLEYRNDVEVALSEASVFCLASDWEGVPFAMMEAMASAVVPIVSDVGTINDWVIHEQNGMLFPSGDSEALASCLRGLFDDEGVKLQKLRKELLGERQRLSFSRGAEVWRQILQLPPVG